MRLAPAVLLCLPLLSCESSSGLLLTIVPDNLQMDQATFDVEVAGAKVASATVPATPRLFAPEGESATVLLPSEALNTTVTLRVAGLLNGTVVGAGLQTTVTTTGTLVPVKVLVASSVPLPACGDGGIQETEVCDDGNVDAGDGCNGACTVEEGWKCSGEPSVCTEACGDGVVDPGEECDDGGILDEDGCAGTCALEPGFVCVNEPSECSFTCGNGTLDVGELCDDSDFVPGDGCGPNCAIEIGWLCGEGACTPICGDGLLRGSEACDDQNTIPADGCSPQCALELGALCSGEPSVCEPGCAVGGETVPADTIDPTDPCRSCQPEVAVEAYSPRPQGSPCAENPNHCDGVDVCEPGEQGVLVCTPTGISPCTNPTFPLCVEETDSCACAPTSCDDGVECNGPETCGAAGTCMPGVSPCSDEAPVCLEFGGSVSCLQCLTSDDCAANPIGSCCDVLQNVCAPARDGCPCGEHDGGNGACVPEGTCSPGFTRAYDDQDGDGVGSGNQLSICVSAATAPPGLSAVNTDCDDTNAAADRIVPAHRDQDGDTFTGPVEQVCGGDVLPPGYIERPARLPIVGLDASSVALAPAPGPSWNIAGVDAERGKYVDGVFVQSETTDNTVPSVPLVITGLGLLVPDDAQIVGVQVQLVRKRGNGGNADIEDAAVKLVVDGAISGDNRARLSEIWGTAPTTVTYGDATDTWGLSLTPAAVNSTGFGVSVSVFGGNGTRAEVDGVRIDVFVAEGVDCDDTDGAVFATWTAGADQDGDGYVAAGSVSPRCISADPRQPRLRRIATGNGDDCYDNSASAFPGQTAFFANNRGDGSFDYNCDGGESKQPVRDVESCADNCLGICPCADCTTTRGNLSEPAEACGGAHDEGACNTASCCEQITQTISVTCH